MLYPSSYGHVMPTAEEHWMIEDAKRKIREREHGDQLDHYANAEFSWSGFMIAIGILTGIGILLAVIATFTLNVG